MWQLPYGRLRWMRLCTSKRRLPLWNLGRHAGWLTAASALARNKFEGDNPVLIYLPEADFELEQFAKDLRAALEKQKQRSGLCIGGYFRCIRNVHL